jgi:transcriptional regulator with XRE-family HTH domain
VPTKKAYDIWTRRRAAKQQRKTFVLGGLKSCRIAATLTQKELADLIGSNQTTIADLESWDTADLHMIRRLCDALRIVPEDLVYSTSVADEIIRESQEWRARNGFGDGDAQRRHLVNRIKRGAHYASAPGTVLLRGLKGRRVAAGLSQRELAEMIGTNQATVQQLEKGTYRGAYMQTVRRLCRALGVSPADLICLESSNKGDGDVSMAGRPSGR